MLVLICFRSLGRAFTWQAHQVPVSLAPRIAAVYSASGALAVLKSNPYKLVVDVKYAVVLLCKGIAAVAYSLLAILSALHPRQGRWLRSGGCYREEDGGGSLLAPSL